MASLMEMVEQVNKGDLIDSELLEVYQESSNSAEKFLSHHAQATLDLRRAHRHMLQSLDAIGYSDQKVISQFISISAFLGLTDERAQPVIRFGSSAIARREYALALEAIGNGVAFDLQHGGAFTADRKNCQFIASQYERAAQCIEWSAGQVLEGKNEQIRVAYIASTIPDDEPSGRTIRGLARHCDPQRTSLGVYSTEAGVRRDRQQFGQPAYVPGSARRGVRTLELLNQRKLPTWIAPTDTDAVVAAKALASQLIKDQVDVAIFDANQADPIAAVVANWDIAGATVNLCRGTPLYASGISCVLYTDQVRYEADHDYWARRGIDSKFILEGIDLDEELGPAPQRAGYGIPDQAMVLATSGPDLERTVSEEFADTIIRLLRAHPHAVYLLIGDGELAGQRRKFESAGVAKRVGYAGKRKDLPGFLRIADIYLAEFPSGSAAGVLQAMSLGKPVVALRWGDSAEHSQAAALAGPECAISGRDPGCYLERVTRIIREPAWRESLGRAMRSRVEQHFAFIQTARHLEQFCEQIIQQASETEGDQVTLRETEPAVAEVA